MSIVQSMDDDQRNRVAEALLDENGLPPTQAALDVIMAVVRATERTDEVHGLAMAERSRGGSPRLNRYAIDAERALRILRKNRVSIR